MTDDYVTRREFEVLQIEVRAMRSDSTAIAVVSAQMQRMGQDIETLTKSVSNRFDSHDKVHAKDAHDRQTGRRWAITTAIAGLAALAGLYGWMALLLHR